MFWGVFLHKFPRKSGFDQRSNGLDYFIHKTQTLQISCSLSRIKIAKKVFLNIYNTEMSLQFRLGKPTRSSVSSAYDSSNEEMEIDSVTSVQDQWDRDSEYDDVQVLACYYENLTFPPQLAAGRAMTTSLTHCLDDLSLPSDFTQSSVDTFTESSGRLRKWPVGHPPSSFANAAPEDHPIAECRQLNPILESPISPPLAEQMPTHHYESQFHSGQYNDQWVQNPHFTALAITASGSCGQPNDVHHYGCIVCGKSFAEITEENTLGYLESNPLPGETYDQRIERRRAFQAGMKAGTFIMVPRGVSQAAACDGLFYQIMPDNDNTNPGPGVLPI